MTIIVFRSVIIYIVVILAVRIMGKRQLGELKPHEFVITMLISAVATIPIQENSIPLTNSLVPIMIFVSLEVIESAISMKLMGFRDVAQGKPVFIIRNGELKQEALKKLRFTVDDLIDALRQKDVFDISEVENAVVETNGSLSVQKKAESCEVTRKDLEFIGEKSLLPIPIVIDSKPVSEYFAQEETKESEINLILSALDIKADEIMLLTLDESGKTYLIKKDKEVGEK